MTSRAIIVGAVDSTRVAVEAIERASDWALAAVVTLPSDKATRHSDFVDLAPVAAASGASIIHVDNINRDAALERVAAVGADMIFVIGWSQICGMRFRDIVQGRVIGYHPAPLPRLRGRAAIPWTILNREPITAGTLFWIDAGTDTGDILDQQFFHVAPDETAASLYARHMTALDTMLDRSLPALARQGGVRTRQDEACATWAARRTPADGRIDWTQPTEAILRLVRASGRPYPGAFTTLDDAQLNIWSARPDISGPRHLARPGQVIGVDDTGFIVMGGDANALRVDEWSGTDRMPRLHATLGDRP